MNKISSESLASIIVTNRVLGLYQEESKECMSELLRRREDEDDEFKFEEYINNKIKDIEDVNNKYIENNNVLSLISSLSSFGKVL